MALDWLQLGSPRAFAESIIAEATRRIKLLAKNDATFVPPADDLSVILAARSLVLQPPAPVVPPDNLSDVIAARTFLRGAVGSGSGGQALTFGTHLTGGSYDGSSPVTLGTDATPNATNSTIMARDTSGGTAVVGLLQSGGVTARFQNTYGTRPTGAAGIGIDLGVSGGVATMETFNPTTGLQTAQQFLALSFSFNAAITAPSITGSSGSTTGNAATATALQTARTINGVSFNGTANIVVTADATTLTGASLPAGVTGSSLTSLGTLSALQLGAGAAPDLPSGGANPTAGTAALGAGTVTVATTAISANHKVIYNRATTGGTAGNLSYTRINGTSITFNSDNAADTSTIDWCLIKVH